jgi:hypothetical protein
MTNPCSQVMNNTRSPLDRKPRGPPGGEVP